jgi:hypothetical protein
MIIHGCISSMPTLWIARIGDLHEHRGLVRRNHSHSRSDDKQSQNSQIPQLSGELSPMERIGPTVSLF